MTVQETVHKALKRHLAGNRITPGDEQLWKHEHPQAVRWGLLEQAVPALDKLCNRYNDKEVDTAARRCLDRLGFYWTAERRSLA